MNTVFYEDLAKAQAEYEAAIKDNIAEGTKFSYSYAGLDNVISAVRPALNKYGIYLLQNTATEKKEVSVSTSFLHSSGMKLETSKLKLELEKTDAQSLGSALTYLRRYSLLSACGIAPEDDDDGAIASGKTNVNTYIVEKIFPLMKELLEEGKFKNSDNEVIEYKPARAFYLIGKLLTKEITLDQVKEYFINYKDKL